VIYKLVEIEMRGEVRPAAKFTSAKVTYPGKKQVYRLSRPDGQFAGDIIGLEQENVAGAEALLVPVMAGGKRSVPRTDLAAARQRRAEQVSRLPQPLLSLAGETTPYPVRHSERLEDLLGEVRRRLERAARI
jgi:nicotinate phosphoribosyltransferase